MNSRSASGGTWQDSALPRSQSLTAVRARMPHCHSTPSDVQVCAGSMLSVPAIATLKPIASNWAEAVATGR